MIQKIGSQYLKQVYGGKTQRTSVREDMKFLVFHTVGLANPDTFAMLICMALSYLATAGAGHLAFISFAYI